MQKLLSMIVGQQLLKKDIELQKKICLELIYRTRDQYPKLFKIKFLMNLRKLLKKLIYLFYQILIMGVYQSH